jgi:L-lactate dehydrogenase complex protein LldG
MFDLFKAKAEAVSAEVVRVPGPAAALEAVLSVMQRERVEDAPGARAVWAEGRILQGLLDRGALTRRVRGLSFEVTKDRAADARVGVSEFDWALAATGTLVQDASDPSVRLVSMLSETHVALVRTGTLLPDMECLLARVDPRRMRWIACVTGASRTADIERVLTIGVHGPKKLVIVAVDGDGGARA